jgi:hypothetical protein
MEPRLFLDEQPNTHLDTRKKHNQLGSVMKTINSVDEVVKVERVDIRAADDIPEQHGWRLYYA